MNAFVIAVTHSGVGKRSVAIGLMAEFKRQRYPGQAFLVLPRIVLLTTPLRRVARPETSTQGSFSWRWIPGETIKGHTFHYSTWNGPFKCLCNYNARNYKNGRIYRRKNPSHLSTCPFCFKPCIGPPTCFRVNERKTDVLSGLQ